MYFVIIASGRVFTVVTDVNLRCWHPDKGVGAAADAREQNKASLLSARLPSAGGVPEERRLGGAGGEK